MFICLRPRTPYPPSPPPPPYTLYKYIQLYLFTHGRGGGGKSWTREKSRGATVLKAGSKIPTCLTESPLSLETLMNTCRKVPLQVNLFRWRHFALVSILLISPCLGPTAPWKADDANYSRGLLYGGSFYFFISFLYKLYLSSNCLRQSQTQLNVKVKRLAVLPSPAGMSLTELSLAGNYLNIPVNREFG